MRSEDGAHLGWSAEEALDAVLGGKQPRGRGVTVDEMREQLLTAPLTVNGYGETGAALGHVMLEFFQRHPECETMPADSDREWPNGWDEAPIIVREGVDTYMKRVEPETYEKYEFIFDELTGFLYGWGVNAARYAMGWGPVNNPAILTMAIGPDDA